VNAHARPAFSPVVESAPAVDPDLFPPGFLRLLAMAPAAVRRLHAGAPDGRRAALGEGGRFLFRGHRAYRPGDDLRRLDWKVEARLGVQMIREYDVERDLLTEVWLDGSASMGLCGGRTAAWRAAALAAALGVGEGGRARLGVLRDGAAEVRAEVGAPGEMRAVLAALSRETTGGRAEWAKALPRLRARLTRGVRLVLVSDLLSRADPGVLSTFGGRGVRGALLHLRVPEVNAPAPSAPFLARDVESGTERLVALDAEAAARVAARAQAHADLWARHAASVGLRYLPFAPGGDDEALLRRLALEAS
jgi:uncharacterized protein (DUF58 family)